MVFESENSLVGVWFGLVWFCFAYSFLKMSNDSFNFGFFIWYIILNKSLFQCSSKIFVDLNFGGKHIEIIVPSIISTNREEDVFAHWLATTLTNQIIYGDDLSAYQKDDKDDEKNDD